MEREVIRLTRDFIRRERALITEARTGKVVVCHGWPKSWSQLQNSMLRASQTAYWRLRVASRNIYVWQLLWTNKNFHFPLFLHHLLSALSQQYLIYIVNSFHGLTGSYQQSSHLPKPNSNRTLTAGLHFIQPTNIVTIYLDNWPWSNEGRVTKRAYWIACNFPPFLQKDSENVR